MDSLYQWMFGQLSINGITFDLDSTVMTRYGTQQGAARGYNPAKRGRASHHPLMAFVSDTRMIANCWLFALIIFYGKSRLNNCHIALD